MENEKPAQLTIRIAPLLRQQLEYIARQEFRTLNDQVHKMLASSVTDWERENQPGTGYPAGY